MHIATFQSLALRLFCLATSLAILVPATHAESGDRPGKLDAFLAGLATDCKPGPRLQNLLDDLVAKYIFDGRVRQNIPLRIPADVKGNFGEPIAINKKTWTAMSLPLGGQFHGMKTREFTFDAGHSNEIYIYSIVLDTSVPNLRKTLGSQIRHWDQKLTRAARAGHEEGFAPRIQSAVPGGSQLVCEFSDS